MRLIDADAAVAEWYRINDIDENDRGARFVGYTEIPRWLYHIPTIDAEPVVHCRDCKYWQDNNGGYPHEECRWGKEETPDAGDFCSYGERREP